MPSSATWFLNMPRGDVARFKSPDLASSEDLPALVRRFSETQPGLRLAGNELYYARFRYKSSEAWAVVATGFSVCNVMVTGTANILEQGDKFLLALQKDAWTGSLPTNKVVWQSQMRKLGTVEGEFQSVDQATFLGTNASKSDGTEIQMTIEFISGKTKIQPLPAK